MYKCINKWTKESMIAHIRANFKGKSLSVGDIRQCLYRGPDGKKCAVGMFIPDNRYVSDMDNPDVGNINATSVICRFNLETFMPLDIFGMEQLQSQHDQALSYTCLDDMIKWINENVES